MERGLDFRLNTPLSRVPSCRAVHGALPGPGLEESKKHHICAAAKPSVLSALGEKPRAARLVLWAHLCACVGSGVWREV